VFSGVWRRVVWCNASNLKMETEGSSETSVNSFVWRLVSSGVWRRVVWCNASNLKMETEGSSETSVNSFVWRLVSSGVWRRVFWCNASNLKMETEGSSETSVNSFVWRLVSSGVRRRVVWCFQPEDGDMILPKRRYVYTRLHVVTPKITLFLTVISLRTLKIEQILNFWKY